ncbi:MAG TPA: signal peptidase II [Planctomycetaceae bacterium]|nr:signal peptidase II [Planctomycetaceae bacterium]
MVFCVLAAAALAWDLGTKHVVFTDLGYPGVDTPAQRFAMPAVAGRHVLFEPHELEGKTPDYLDGWLKFRLFTSFNEGALWGLGQGWTAGFAALSVVAFAFVVYFLFWRGAACSLWLTLALGLITGGILGNLYDRLGLHGYENPRTGETWRAVRDFLHFEFGALNWPVFNFADVFLVTGAVMLVVQQIAVGSGEHEGESQQSEPLND